MHGLANKPLTTWKGSRAKPSTKEALIQTFRGLFTNQNGTERAITCSTCNWYDVRTTTRPITTFCFHAECSYIYAVQITMYTTLPTWTELYIRSCTQRKPWYRPLEVGSQDKTALYVSVHLLPPLDYTSWPSYNTRLLIAYTVHLHSWRWTETIQWATILGAEVVCWTVCIRTSK